MTFTLSPVFSSWTWTLIHLDWTQLVPYSSLKRYLHLASLLIFYLLGVPSLCLLLISHHLLDLLMFMSTDLSAITLISLMISSCLMIFRHNLYDDIFQFVSPAQIFPAIWLVHPVFPLDTNRHLKVPMCKAELLVFLSTCLIYSLLQLCWGQYHLSSCSALKPQSSPRFFYLIVHMPLVDQLSWLLPYPNLLLPTTSLCKPRAPGHLHHCAGACKVVLTCLPIYSLYRT